MEYRSCWKVIQLLPPKNIPGYFLSSSQCQHKVCVNSSHPRSNKQTDCLRFHLSGSPGFASHHVSSHPVTLILSHEINKQKIILNCSRYCFTEYLYIWKQKPFFLFIVFWLDTQFSQALNHFRMIFRMTLRKTYIQNL